MSNFKIGDKVRLSKAGADRCSMHDLLGSPMEITETPMFGIIGTLVLEGPMQGRRLTWGYEDSLEPWEGPIASVVTKAQHEPPYPRCGHKAAPEHCTEEARQEEREVAKLGAFGPFHSKEVVNVKVVRARCWNCENKWEVYL